MANGGSTNLYSYFINPSELMDSPLLALLTQPVHEAVLDLELSDNGLTFGVRFPQMKGLIHTLDELVTSELENDDRFDGFGGDWEVDAFSTLYEFHLNPSLSELERQIAFREAYSIVLKFIEIHWNP